LIDRENVGGRRGQSRASDYDLDAPTQELVRRFAGIQAVGCKTAGEIGPAGYRPYSVAIGGTEENGDG
jgi:hypothetical protein